MISDHRPKIDVVHTVENIIFDHIADLTEMLDQLRHLITLGTLFTAAGSTVLCKATCTLDKMQLMIVSPCLDICFFYHIKRTDQFHPFKILAVKLRHHGLYFSAIEHPHEDRLDHIIKMMSQRDLVASQLLGMGIEIASSHAGTQITGIAVNFCHNIENIALEDGQRNIQKLCIILDNLPIVLIVTWIHHQKYKLKREFSMSLQLLHELRHEHGILSAGDADCDLVPLLDQIIFLDRTRKTSPDGFPEFFNQASLNLLGLFFSCVLFFHEALQLQTQICAVTSGNISRIVSMGTEQFHIIKAPLTCVTQNPHRLILRDLFVAVNKFLHGNIDGSLEGSSLIRICRAHIYDGHRPGSQLFQFFYGNGLHAFPPVFTFARVSALVRSFTTSPAMISPTTDGTNALLPGIARRSVHLRTAPGGQFRAAMHSCRPWWD